MQTQDHQSTSGLPLDSIGPASAAPLTPHPPTINSSSGIEQHEAPNPDSKKEQELRLKFAEETHQYVREYIRIADQKATFYFAGSTALLAYLHKLGVTNSWITNPKAWGLVDMFAFWATVGLILSTIACLATVMPRLNGSRRGIIFFAAIREYESSRDYASEVMNQSSTELCEAKLRHAYDLSGICKNKYDVLKWGQWLGGSAVIVSLLLIILQ